MNKSHLEYMWNMRSKGLTDTTKSKLLKPSGKNNSCTNRDYVQAIAKLSHYQRSHEGVVFDDSYTYETIINGLSKAEQFRLWFHTPCLAKRYDDLTSKEQNDIFDNQDWIFTEKIKGVRAVLVIYNGDVHIFSRNYSEDDCHIPDYKSKILPIPILNDGVTFCADIILRLTKDIDISQDLHSYGISETSTPIEQLCGLLQLEPSQAIQIQKDVRNKFGKDLVEFVLISPLHFKGERYIIKQLGDCISAYDECVSYGVQLGFNIKPFKYMLNASRTEKEIFLNTCLKNGLDGVVAHYKYGAYHTTEPRSRTSYIKIKRNLNDTTRLGDTIDGYITGFRCDNERITHVNVSVNVEFNGNLYPHIIAVVPVGITISKLLTVHGFDGYAPFKTDNGDIISLNLEYKHYVCELNADGINTKRMLINPKLLRLRPDKLDCECIYSKEFILSHIKEPDTDNIKRTNV